MSFINAKTERTFIHRKKISHSFLNWVTKDNVSHLNHFLSVLEGVHGGLRQHDFAPLRVDVHLLLPECVILKNGKMSVATPQTFKCHFLVF